MKIAGCSNNNLSRPSFGMMVDFDAEDMRNKGINLPNYDVMNESRKLANTELYDLCRKKQAQLKYVRPTEKRGFPYIFGLGKQIIDTWHLVMGGITSEEIKVPRDSQLHGKIAGQIIKAAREVAHRDRYQTKSYHVLSTVVKEASRV